MIDEILVFFLMLGLGLLLVCFVVQKLTPPMRNLPPGPTGLPIVGYLPFLSRVPHIDFNQLAEKYGNVFSLYLGSQLVVVLNDGDAFRKAFSKRELLGRPPSSAFSLFGLDTPFFSPDVRMWQEERKFMVQMMKDLKSEGKSKIEGLIQDEIRHFLEAIEKTCGKPTNLRKLLTPSMSNIMCSLVFGERYDYDNPVRVLLDDTLDLVGSTAAQTSAHFFLPWVRKVPFLVRLLTNNRTIQTVREFFDFIDQKISEHKKTLEPGIVRDYIDGYLLDMKERKEKDPKTTFSDDTMMKGSVVSLFGAGSETVRTTVTWCLYVMASFPEIQMKVREEVKNALGSSKSPEISDQKNMPYTQAVIREIMRWKTTMPLNLLRITVEDTKVSVYDVPKGTVVVANLWAIHHSPKHWENPEDFRPERFLNPDGTLTKTSYFVPFSVGKRSCPGETMAVMEVFLYFVSILQKFKVCFPDGYQPDFDAELGITLRLKPFEICFKS